MFHISHFMLILIYFSLFFVSALSHLCVLQELESSYIFDTNYDKCTNMVCRYNGQKLYLYILITFCILECFGTFTGNNIGRLGNWCNLPSLSKLSVKAISLSYRPSTPTHVHLCKSQSVSKEKLWIFCTWDWQFHISTGMYSPVIQSHNSECLTCRCQQQFYIPRHKLLYFQQLKVLFIFFKKA